MGVIIDLFLLVLHCFLSHIFVAQTFYTSSVDSLGPGCKCVQFERTQGREYGIFTSPNWPNPYENSIECLLYTFIAAPDQLIEITFDEFDVQKINLDCVYGDFVKLFLHLPDGMSSVDENDSWNDVLCGKIADIEQTHYSSGSSLVFEFHSDWRAGNNSGFRGTFRFLSKRMFETDGKLLPNTQCDYQFESLPSATSSIQTSTPRAGTRAFPTTSPSHGSLAARSNRGNFFSPQYPSTYPKNIRCSYKFIGQEFERVKLVFEQVILLKSDLSCLKSSDVINVYDGPDTTGQVIGQFCNTNNFVQLFSTRNYLFVEFWSRSHFPGQGFKGSFFFEPILSSSVSHDSPTDFKGRLKGFGARTLIDGFSGSGCNSNFSSDVQKSGSFHSPSYPNSYPPGLNCVYQFSGSGRERIQIVFTDFDLLLHSDDTQQRDCEDADSVKVLVDINGNKERIDNFCGTSLPYQVMSNGPTLRVEFISTKHHLNYSSNHPSATWSSNAHYRNQSFRGFRATYKFLTDFGVLGHGVQNLEKVCEFNFKSSQRKSGTFTSPNYPGLYPRETECHYFFYGEPHERVHVNFSHFDVEGVPPCTHESASDYIECSNYHTADRKLPRNCGIRKPSKLTSDSEFFRIIFKSNEKFDGTGFEAFYHFENNPPSGKSVASATIPKQTVPSSSSNFVPNHLLIMISFAYLLVA